MRILLATRSLAAPAGSETYVETVAPELRRLGHDVEVWAPLHGVVAERLRAVGVPVLRHLDDRDGPPPDIAHVQHSSMAMRVRGRFPDLPLVYVCHSSVLDIEDPPAIARPQAIVAMSDVVTRRLEAGALAERVPIVRLRQPVTVPFSDSELQPLPDAPRTAVLVGDRAGLIRSEVEQACADHGIDLNVVGTGAERVDDLQPAFMRADLVFAVGRSLLEAMALGRACFIVDDRGAWGFLSEQSYADAERQAFSRLTDPPTDPIVVQLEQYRPSLGSAAAALARRHHSSRTHARDLVEVYRQALEAPPPGPIDPLEWYDACADDQEEMFRLTFAHRAAEWTITALEHEIARLREARTSQVSHLAACREELAARCEELAARDADLTAIQATRVVRWSQPARSLYTRLRGPQEPG